MDKAGLANFVWPLDQGDALGRKGDFDVFDPLEVRDGKTVEYQMSLLPGGSEAGQEEEGLGGGV